MANIAVLSLNPALDVTYKIQKLVDDEKIHSFETRFDPGGNGINVGRAFKRLKTKATTCCVLAGKIGTLIADILRNELDDPHFIWEEGETRINCVIQQSDPVSQYEINGMGPAMSASVLDKLEKELYAYSKDGFAVLTGSPPLNITHDIYSILCMRLKNAGIKCLVDADGALLNSAVKSKPYIIKPNIHELERLVKRNLDSVNDIAAAAKELHNYGIEYVFISIGHKGDISLKRRRYVRCVSGSSRGVESRSRRFYGCRYFERYRKRRQRRRFPKTWNSLRYGNGADAGDRAVYNGSCR